ncbi:hypothetical protein [Actinomadura sp. 6K520]|uniref:hypothetical protein n=1 Tax=Actinomadura sp. 6K520 TaxID=2530364 RepID=UPI00104FA4D4|nr:hypothetical protein [Actinomadura sp. 6K520]TDE27138.1 hypothetical protein E1289_23695 [Actinomadura sp. 6K520]
MEPAPIHRGANRPQDRPRHAVVLVLVRVIAIAGFAVAGWLAMAALTDSASAAESGPRVPVLGDGTVRKAAPAFDELARAEAGVRPMLGGVPGQVREQGGRRLRSLGAWEGEVSGVPGRLRDFRDDPVRFLKERRHEVFADKDRTVRQVRELADAAGVPRVEIARVEIAGVRPGASLGSELVHGVTDVRPGLPADEPQAEQIPGSPASDETHARGEEPPGGTGSVSADRSSLAGAATADEAPDHCTGCRGDRHPADPALPSGQDNPRGAGSGGHPFTPVADLLKGRHPAAPPAARPGTFHRTALTDVAAPGGPSVVPD